jgi:hypothetical protein
MPWHGLVDVYFKKQIGDNEWENLRYGLMDEEDAFIVLIEENLVQDYVKQYLNQHYPNINTDGISYDAGDNYIHSLTANIQVGGPEGIRIPRFDTEVRNTLFRVYFGKLKFRFEEPEEIINPNANAIAIAPEPEPAPQRGGKGRRNTRRRKQRNTRRRKQRNTRRRK